MGQSLKVWARLNQNCGFFIYSIEFWKITLGCQGLYYVYQITFRILLWLGVMFFSSRNLTTYFESFTKLALEPCFYRFLIFLLTFCISNTFLAPKEGKPNIDQPNVQILISPSNCTTTVNYVEKTYSLYFSFSKYPKKNQFNVW